MPVADSLIQRVTTNRECLSLAFTVAIKKLLLLVSLFFPLPIDFERERERGRERETYSPMLNWCNMWLFALCNASLMTKQNIDRRVKWNSSDIAINEFASLQISWWIINVPCDHQRKQRSSMLRYYRGMTLIISIIIPIAPHGKSSLMFSIKSLCIYIVDRVFLQSTYLLLHNSTDTTKEKKRSR